MPNVLDVIDIHPDGETSHLDDDASNRLSAIDEELARVQWLGKKIEEGSLDYAHKRRFEELRTAVKDAARESEEAFYWDIFCAHKQLPAQIAARAPALLTKMAKTPRASLAEIREIATRLGFVIIPWAYLSEKSYEQEPREMRSAISEFSKVDGRMDVYVVCPPMHYSFGKHLEAEDPNKPIFAGKNEQAFMALQLSLPPLRAMQAQVNVLTKNQESLGRGYEELRAVQRQQAQAVKSMQESIQAQLEQIQRRIESDIRGAATALIEEAKALAGRNRLSAASKARLEEVMNALQADKAEIKDIKDAAAALAAVRFDLFEPLMFALPKGTPLQANDAAYLGPCWGPDFEEILLVAAELKCKGQRAHAEEKLSVWKPYREEVYNSYGGYDNDNEYRRPIPFGHTRW